MCAASRAAALPSLKKVILFPMLQFITRDASQMPVHNILFQSATQERTNAKARGGVLHAFPAFIQSERRRKFEENITSLRRSSASCRKWIIEQRSLCGTAPSQGGVL